MLGAVCAMRMIYLKCTGMESLDLEYVLEILSTNFLVRKC